MGLFDKSQVPPMLLIDNEFIDRTKLPEVGTTITGIPTYVTIDNIIAAEGDMICSLYLYIYPVNGEPC
jgi:hypothetical protein